MQNEFTEYEAGIIKNMMLSKPVKDIAFVLDRNPEDILSYITAITQGTDIETKQMQLDRKQAEIKHRKKAGRQPMDEQEFLRIQREKQVQKEKKAWEEKMKKKTEESARHRKIVDAKQKVSNLRRVESQSFKTKNVDYSQMHMVKVSKGTYIYIRKGESERKAIEAYHEKMNRLKK